MTGQEFENWIKHIGLKKSDVAKRLGVDPDTITARCKDEKIPQLYAYALMGLAAENKIESLQEFTEIIGIIKD